MDQRLKERLIGAAVLVALGVWLIPLLLDGPNDAVEDAPVSLQLPIPDVQNAEVRTEVIDLDGSDSDSGNVAGRAAPATDPGSSAAASASSSDSARGNSSDASSGDTSAAAASARDTAPADGDGHGASAAAAGDHDQPAADDTEPAPQPVEAAARAAASSSVTDATPEPPAAERDAPAAASEEQPAPAGDWAIQLGSFGDEANARRLAERVTSFGYAPRIVNFRAGGRTMYRVRVGPHETRGAAEAAASALKAHGFVAQVVTAD